MDEGNQDFVELVNENRELKAKIKYLELELEYERKRVEDHKEVLVTIFQTEE